MNIAIYKQKDEITRRFGLPATYTLEEPPGSREWIEPAAYQLPERYAVGQRRDGTLGIWNGAGHYCHLIDGAYRGQDEQPMLYDFDQSNPTKPIRLEKVGDLTFEEAEQMNRGFLNEKEPVAVPQEPEGLEEEPEP